MPVKDIIYLAAIAAIAAGLLWFHHSAVLEGEAKVKASDAAAVVKAQAAVQTQKLSDDKLAEGVTNDLKTQISSLTALASAPTPVMRLCNPARGSSPVSAKSGTTAGTQPGATDSGSVPGVLSGTNAEPDIGPTVRDITFSCAVVSTYRERLIEWALGQSQPVK